MSVILDIDTAIISKIERGERSATRDQVNSLINFFKLDEKETMAAWLADRVYQILEDEEYASEALMVAEQAVRYERQERTDGHVPDATLLPRAIIRKLFTLWSYMLWKKP